MDENVKIGYKVVAIKEGKYFSFLACCGWSRYKAAQKLFKRYQMRKKVEFEFGPGMAFETFESANNFVYHEGEGKDLAILKIYYVEDTEKRHVILSTGNLFRMVSSDLFCGLYTEEELKDYYQGCYFEAFEDSYRPIPDGTIFCKWIKPIRCMEKYLNQVRL